MDLSAKKELRWLSAVLADVEEAAPEADFLIVGAMARDLLLHYGHGVPITRATTDIDLGVTVGSWDEFRQLRDACLDSPVSPPAGLAVTGWSIAAAYRSISYRSAEWKGRMEA